MTNAIYVCLPHDMALEVRSRAAAAGQGRAEWVRDRIASSLRRPRPRALGQGRAPAPAEVKRLVMVQEAIAKVGLSLQLAIRNEAKPPRPGRPRSGYAKIVPSCIETLRNASAGLAALINARGMP